MYIYYMEEEDDEEEEEEAGVYSNYPSRQRELSAKQSMTTNCLAVTARFPVPGQWFPTSGIRFALSARIWHY